MKWAAFMAVFAVLAACNAEPTWHEFREAHIAFYDDGQPVYVLEGDMILSEDRLQTFYQRHVAPTPDGVGRTSQAAIVDRENRADAIWSRTQALDLTWCIADEIVDDGFNSDRDKITAAMNEATRDWERAASSGFFWPVNFKRRGACSGDVKIKIVPWPKANAFVLWAPEPTLSFPVKAPFPADYVGKPMPFYVDVRSAERNQWHLPTIFRHEVGHTLGLRHEHIRPEAGNAGCGEDWYWRPVSSYDPNSIMGYTNGCGQGVLPERHLSWLDKFGIRKLYDRTSLIRWF